MQGTRQQAGTPTSFFYPSAEKLVLTHINLQIKNYITYSGYV